MDKTGQTSKKKKKSLIDVRKMGVNIDKNEYYTIKDSFTNYPENYFRK
ncbi:MAG: hypothetical protein K6E29_02040 [Cyanobacteria bacterium RUI128]|nr:hypothetical protein [Cyanobacteria bacterium RUI128]